MNYKMLLCDIDGTLRPFPEPRVPRANAEAVQAVQSHGVKFVISTGRSRMAIPEEMLNGIQPDYWICAAGAQVLRGDGTELAIRRMPLAPLKPLIAFCKERSLPLRLAFSDGIYAYSGYEPLLAWLRERDIKWPLFNGENHRRHLTELPFAVNGILPEAAAREFNCLYPEAGLRFLYIKGDHCDILWQGLSKAEGLKTLLEKCNLSAEECVSVGDSGNDAELLMAAGMSYCVADGAPQAQAAAKRICPAAESLGVAAVCRELWPEAFGMIEVSADGKEKAR